MAEKKFHLKYVETVSGWRWRVRYRDGKKDSRSFHKTKDLAEAEVASLRDQIQSAGELWISLPAFERNQLMMAYREAKERGVDIRAAIANAQNGHSKSASLSTVISELKTTKLNHGANAQYVKNLGIVLNQFARGKESLPIHKVTLSDVESFLDSKNLVYRATLRGRLSTLFGFSVRRGYRTDNPCTRLEQIKITRPSPSIFTIGQFQSAIEWIRENYPRGLSWFVLATLCGLRPEEAEKTRKEDIHFKDGFVRVEAQTTKVRQRRVVYPKSEAMALLKWATKRGGELPFEKSSRRIMLSGRKSKPACLRSALGFKVWPKDITRHTAASYWLASDASTAHVAKMLGNSEKTLESHYKALVTRAEAEEFWKVVSDLGKNR